MLSKIRESSRPSCFTASQWGAVIENMARKLDRVRAKDGDILEALTEDEIILMEDWMGLMAATIQPGAPGWQCCNAIHKAFMAAMDTITPSGTFLP